MEVKADVYAASDRLVRVSKIQARPFSRRAVLVALLVFAGGSNFLRAQDANGELPNAPQAQTYAQASGVSLKQLPGNFLRDQGAIWSSPARLRDSNAAGPILLVLATAGAITADHQAMSSAVTHNATTNDRAVQASNGLLGGFVAAPAMLYGMGWLRHNEHATETGLLGAEAMADSVAVNEVLKLVSMRERPEVDNAKGRFFQTGVGADSSFPSNHCAVAWSSAAVLASEYNGPLTKIAAYGLATGVSFTRVIGQQHFPSDVLVGSAVGWMIGRYVVHRHRRISAGID